MKNLLSFLFIFMITSLSAQKVKLWLNEAIDWQETQINQFDKKKVYTSSGNFTYAQIDTLRFIEQGSFEFMNTLAKNKVPYFVGDARPSSVSSQLNYNAKPSAMSSKKVADIMKGIGFFMASSGVVMHFPPVDVSNPQSIDEYNDQNLIANSLILTGGLFVMFGYFIDSDR
jgi:hypothetical protein